MKKILLAFGLIFLFFTAWYYWRNPPTAKVKIRDQIFWVEVAVTPKERERGLSGRETLAPNRGMLFIFASPGVYHFWMRGMQFPLDFIWIKENRVVDISKNIPPPRNSEPQMEVAPSEPVDKVLEVNAGTVGKLQIQVGDQVEYSTN